MNEFHQYIEAAIADATSEAEASRSATVEAHHLLLAIAAQEGTTGQQVLASVGLDRAALRDALQREFEHSLEAVGVHPAEYALPASRGKPGKPPRFGPSASVRLAFTRGMGHGDRNPQPVQLLLGILEAEVGTVPRALALAGVDRTELRRRALEALEGGGPAPNGSRSKMHGSTRP